MRRVIFITSTVLLACTAERDTFDTSPDAEASADTDAASACFEFCPASFVGIPVAVSCAANVVDASLGGACATLGNWFACDDPAHPDAAPFRDCDPVFVRTPKGTCNVEIDFASGFVYSATIEVTQGPGDRCCSGMLTPTPTGLIVDETDASCDTASD